MFEKTDYIHMLHFIFACFKMMLQLNKKYVYLCVSISQGVNTSRGSESAKSTSHFIESSQ